MTQEDKGLVVRGLLLLALIGCIVAFVLTILFWRSQPPASVEQAPPEQYIPLAVLPGVGPFPANISWAVLPMLADSLPSAPGWEIRYNAAAALARRGSPATPWPLLREMLDEKQQRRNARTREKDDKMVYDESAARATMIAALRAIAAWHEKRRAEGAAAAPAELRDDVYPAVDELAEHAQGEVQAQAEKARATFFR